MSSLGARYMVTSALAFAVMSALVKLAGARLPSQEIVAARAAITLMLSYAALRAARVTPLLGHDRRLLVLRGTFGFLALSCGYYSVTHLPLAEATVLQYLHPPVTALLAALVLGEALSARVFASMALSAAGLLLVTRPALLFGASGPALPTYAVLAGVAGALLSSCAYVTVRKLGRSEDPMVIVFYFPFIALPASIPMMWSTALWPTPAEWLLLLAVGVFTQIGQVSVTRGLQHDEAGRAAAYTYLQVLFAALLGLGLFAEVPSASTLWGGGLILAGAALNARKPQARPASG
jgi:drug/metabolite transporter (DMT)-like permease